MAMELDPPELQIKQFRVQPGALLLTTPTEPPPVFMALLELRLQNIVCIMPLGLAANAGLQLNEAKAILLITFIAKRPRGPVPVRPLNMFPITVGANLPEDRLQ